MCAVSIARSKHDSCKSLTSETIFIKLHNNITDTKLKNINLNVHIYNKYSLSGDKINNDHVSLTSVFVSTVCNDSECEIDVK